MLLSFIFCLYLAGRHFPVLSCFVCRLFGGLADIFLFYLVLSADFLVGWRTFSCFLLFCLPTFCEPGRQTLYFHAFVCRRWLNTADIFFTFMLLSAASACTRQTYSLLSCFCLPPQAEHGRQTLYFHAFVCLRWLNTADKFFTFMLLSASAACTRQTYGGRPALCPPVQ